MSNIALTPAAWSFWTELVKDSKPDTNFLINKLLGGVRTGGKVKFSPIEDIKYDFYKKPQAAAPLRGFHDETVKVDLLSHREQRVARIPSIPMEEDVDIRFVYDAVPAPMENLRASIERLNPYVKQQIADKQNEMLKMVDRRIEVQLGQIIKEGKITYDDSTFAYTHDFELAPDSFFTASKKWDANDAKIVEDLRQWRNKYATRTGRKPTLILCGSNVADVLVWNKDVKETLSNYTYNRGMQSQELSTSDLSERILTIDGIGEIWNYFGAYDDVASSGKPRTEYLDKDRIYFIDGDPFSIFYGSIYSTLFGQNNPIRQMSVFSYVDEKPNHKGYKVYLETKPLPVISNPYSIMSVKVL